MSKDEEKHPSQYLNDLEEWQSHQYDPGYWTGGKIPPMYRYYKNSKKRLGSLLMFSGIVLILFTFVPIILNGASFPESIYENFSAFVITSLFGILLTMAGIKILHKK